MDLGMVYRSARKKWLGSKKLIQMDADGQTGSTHAAYSAKELTVITGQELTIVQEESGWLWCYDQQGKHGWVPISHVIA